MDNKVRELGMVKLIQIQPSGLIVRSVENEIYDPSRRVEVSSLFITSLGVEAVSSNGERVLDIHHIDHPDKAYDNEDLVSIGFTSHYEAMRNRFGKHVIDGTAGENIVVEFEQEVWMDNIGKQIAIENAKTGEKTYFDVTRFAAPCDNFSHFVADKQDERLPAADLKSTLQFLNDGRRGFLLVLSADQISATVQAGDRVFAVC